MATKTKPKQSIEWARGVAEALRAARQAGFGPQVGEMEEIAEELDVPALFVEAALTYDLDAVEKLVGWWPALADGGDAKHTA